jgi:hypothetical protein
MRKDNALTYSTFLKDKLGSVQNHTIEPTRDLNEHLFPFQRDVVKWALRKGRAALFADCGMGKTLMQLDWAHHVSEQGKVLILAPLAVADQTVREGAKFGIPATYAREPVDEPITVTNYEMLDRFRPEDYAGVVLDESSILKAYDGKTRSMLINAFRETPYRLACTATPAPNDHMELGNHSEFLGIKTRAEMLGEFFVHDGGSTQHWRIKGHAQDHFWRWICSWAVMLRKPSDLGYPDGDFTLPPLLMEEHVVHMDHEDAWKEGVLFALEAQTLSEQRLHRKATREKRVAVAAEIAAQPGPHLIWCEFNAEADAMEAAVDDAVQVRGSDSRVLVTKPSIAGFGMNWQHCASVVFAGASHSYEMTYQAVRRCWRFGQPRPVVMHVIRADTEGAVLSNLKRKEQDAERMAAAMLVHMRDIQKEEVRGSSRDLDEYEPHLPIHLPTWLKSEAGKEHVA